GEREPPRDKPRGIHAHLACPSRVAAPVNGYPENPDSRRTKSSATAIFQAVEFVRMESCSTQAVLPLVGLAADKVIRDRYSMPRSNAADS
ncbi:MAG: hypothetical protein ACQESR_10165, partial [Planctomycetota bacterium]